MRVAVMVPYWDFWEKAAGDDFRSSREALPAQIAEHLAGAVDVVVAGLVDSAESAVRLAQRSVAEGAQALLVAQSMVTPPSFSLAAIEALSDQLPLVIWVLHQAGVVPVGLDRRTLAMEQAMVGAPMLTSCLLRGGRRFELILGRVSDPTCVEQVRRTIRLAGIAGALRHVRVARIGAPPEGYDCLAVSDNDLRSGTGVEIVPITSEVVLEYWRAVSTRRIGELRDEAEATWEYGPRLEVDDALSRSLRAAAAMQQLVDDFQLDAGTLNCHVPEIRFGEEIGITPCYALGRLTSLGVPWSCLGDVLTAIAMLLVKRLGGAAVFGKLDLLDYETGELVVTNGGEHDLEWCAPSERPRLLRNGWHDGLDPRCGVCASFGPKPGASTLVAMAPRPVLPGAFRIVVGSGELSDRRFPQAGTINAAFRFTSQPPEGAWLRWVKTGVHHRLCITSGAYAADLDRLGHFLGIETVQV